MSLPPYPYPGLRPYSEEQQEIFFGRERHVAEVLALLSRQHFIAIVGESGCGKSSLVRAGVLPFLRGGMMDASGRRWAVASLRPGTQPVRSLLDALGASWSHARASEASLDQSAQTNALSAAGVAREATVNFAVDQLSAIEVTVLHSSVGLVEAVRVILDSLAADTQFLLLVDQFEELFTYRQIDGERRNVANQFVRLLLHLIESNDSRVFVILMMRIDFLHDCAVFPGLSETLNRGQYLVPPMRREQRRRAIELPARLYQKSIAPRLVERVLNDAGDASDQLPVLQHAMMRAWERAADPDVDVVDMQHYTSGGAIWALSDHANEIYGELPDDGTREVAERVFKALSQRTLDGRIVRRPCKFEFLCELLGGDATARERLATVVDRFSGPGRDFLAPLEGVGDDVVVDISHEALLRVWNKLSGPSEARGLPNAEGTGWIAQEAAAADEWLGLKRQAKIYAADQVPQNVLRGHALDAAEKLWGQQAPNLALAKLWDMRAGDKADRSEGNLREVQNLILASQQLRKKERSKEQLRRYIWIAAAFGFVVLIGRYIIDVNADNVSLSSKNYDLTLENANLLVERGDYESALGQLNSARESSGGRESDEMRRVRARALLGKGIDSLVSEEPQAERYLREAVLADAAIQDQVDHASSSPIRMKEPADPLPDSNSVQILPPDPRLPKLAPGATYNVVTEKNGEVVLAFSDNAGLLSINTKELFLNVDTVLELVDSAGKVVTSDDDGGGSDLASKLDVFISEEAPYRLRVKNISRTSGGFELVLVPLHPTKWEDILLVSQEIGIAMRGSPDELSQTARAFVDELSLGEGRKVELGNSIRANAYLARGVNHLTDGEMAAAYADLAKALEFGGDLEVLNQEQRSAAASQLNIFAWNAVLEMRGESARREVELAVALVPKDWNVLDTRGQIYLQVGMFAEAINDLSLAIEGGVSNPGTFFGRGKANEMLGHPEMAINDYRAALSIARPATDPKEEAYFGSVRQLSQQGVDRLIAEGVNDLPQRQ